MRIKVLSTVFAAIVVTMSLSTLHMANAVNSSQLSPVKPNSKQDAMKNMITAGLQLANQSSQQWQQKHNQSNDQQEQPLIENSLVNHNNKFDNHSPSILAQLPF
jgi:nitrate reductase cytochrome c-type subunit